MRIFVSIASYCDPVLPFTLERAVAMAADGARLRHRALQREGQDGVAVGGDADEGAHGCGSLSRPTNIRATGCERERVVRARTRRFCMCDFILLDPLILLR